MQDFLWNTASFIIALGILVTIHEFGHFWVARRCGVKVHRFSIGFGPAVLKKVAADGTEYVVAPIPLGGYVKMLDSRLEQVAEEELKYAFDQQSVLKRIAIVAAGPLANFILAIAAFCLMYLIGINNVKPMVSAVAPNTAVSQLADITPFEVVSIGPQETQDWESVNFALAGIIGHSEVTLSYRQEGNSRVESTQLDLSDWSFDPKTTSPIRSLGLIPFQPEVYLTLANVLQNSAADKAGLMAEDEIVAVNGQGITQWSGFTDIVRNHPGKALLITVIREGQQIQLTVTPDSTERNGQEIGYIGVVPDAQTYPKEYIITSQYGLIDAFAKASQRTWDLTVLTFDTIGKLIVGTISINNLSGPVSLAKGAGASADYGFVYFLSFLALISINLGLINLFPLPVLDGGHLLYYCIELISGRPVPEHIQEIGFKIGLGFILFIMSVAILNDFNLL
ncbi:sigma E protease regulator RseP [Motilimonas pumila]|uniref:Zinc metalloprotease n=1 Tax=Motilimonas pumila TaxID=2303987 RepID=A0A418YH85_9GAMM|nr:sigma E protease regulator RseP [Motilimonas pumila]RJG49069.1 sigma E protease regulator RseP [Motilimonas pumila]